MRSYSLRTVWLVFICVIYLSWVQPAYAMFPDALCGPNCFVAVCRMLGTEVTIEEAKALCGADSTGTTLAGLTRAAEAKGFSAVPMKIGARDLAAAKCRGIAHLWANHFVVAAGGDRDTIYIADPPGELRPVPIADFETVYSGFALLISKDRSLIPRPKREGADLRINEYHWDFGTVRGARLLERTFICNNVGSEDLAIYKLASSCGCVATALSADKIPPGGKSEFTVFFSTEGRRGPQHQIVQIYSNDAIAPIAQVHIYGIIRLAGLPFSPHSVHFGQVRKGQSASRGIVIPKSEAEPLAIKEALSDTSFVSVDVAEQPHRYLAMVTLEPTAPIGELEGKVTFSTDHADYPSLQIPITASVTGNVDVIPATLFFGLAREGANSRARVTLSKTDGHLNIQTIDNPFDYMSIDVAPKVEGKEYVLTATLNGDAPLGNIKSEVVIHTNDPNQPEIKVPVYAYVEES